MYLHKKIMNKADAVHDTNFIYDQTALRLRDSLPDILRQPRNTCPGKQIPFGNIPFHSPIPVDSPELLLNTAPLSFVHLCIHYITCKFFVNKSLGCCRNFIIYDDIAVENSVVYVDYV